MAAKQDGNSRQKDNMHPRNVHRGRYDFAALTKASSNLRGFVTENEFGDLSVNFSDDKAVKALNQALLKQFYKVEQWDIPDGFLCPPIPGRSDYIHYLADLLAETNNGTIPTGKGVKVLDVGVGANCIYPLIGNAVYGWSFTGSDADYIAAGAAGKIVQANGLAGNIEIRKQSSFTSIFEGIIKPGERFDATMCNPPFHSSLKEANEATGRKWKNLDTDNSSKLNFGGRNNELWCEGGEVRFLNKMISESVTFARQVGWFTSLVSKKTTLAGCYKSLDYFKASQVKTIEMAQGQKVSRILAWRFD
ncbi:23S rRNA (adenine(1618)-N(6))-methyltransferase RlmF [Mucilaginibacter pallidiroseus]|uniref:Ribosomal RNA large subunit methyltransferase F n=1 Tax=Mucilaginibacter pallidiroseus TaxID=2599295 RepID=A0A563UEI9_9SPHI|nr:23S rRNA (adenine(1618)-N(6))-methyltransferase RlmF [Mucilaginibacter pallidiroseus]TWR29787.1 23S rRNA (adenine(1618)-N(6))-methyltransferase RlmF [Mucilaginibacter pallidiroseus]